MKKVNFTTIIRSTFDPLMATENLPPFHKIHSTTDTLTTEVTPSSCQAVRPADVLTDDQNSTIAEDGTILRKGTVKATIENIKVLNSLFQLASNQERREKIAEILDVVDELVRPLHHIELFNFFTPLEWLQDPYNQGRILVTLRYFILFKDQLTLEIKQRLSFLDECCQPEVRQNIHELLS